jgi:hypothetical protein
MACWKLLTLVGLVLNLVGVILLFFYVLPRRVRTDGIRGLMQGSVVHQELLKLERSWDFWSNIGLGCVIIGIVLQAVGVWFSP